MEQKILDIAHVSFLEIIRTLIAQVGPSSTKGNLVRVAVKAGEKIDAVDFASFDDFVKAIDDASNPLAQVEGQAVHLGDGVFGLPRCPFAGSISNFKAVFGALPDSYAEVTAEFNKPGAITDELRVGNGSGVSPFCAVHQPMRASTAKRITIGGRPIAVYQLGCKSASGKKALAEKWITEGGWSKEQVERVLDTNMCCYGIKIA